MKTVYNSDKFEVRQYGVNETYLLLDKDKLEFMVFEPPHSYALAEALQDSADIEMTDIYLEGVMAMGRRYNETEQTNN